MSDSLKTPPVDKVETTASPKGLDQPEPAVIAEADGASPEQAGDEEAAQDGLGKDILQDQSDILEKLVMDEDEFNFYIKPSILPRTIEEVVQKEVDDRVLLREMNLLQDIVTKSGATIFVDTDDPICEQAFNIMKSLKLSMYSVRLDIIDQGDKIKELILGSSGQASLPTIFINGDLIGGYEDLWYLYYTNLITHTLTRGNRLYRNNFSFEYQLIVIGGGPAGISAALEAAKLGKKVALVNYVPPSARGRSWGIGGTYVNAGSISKNLMYTASNFVHSFNGHGQSKLKKGSPNWPKLVKNICEHIKSITFSLRRKMKEAGCEYIHGVAKFLTDHSIEVTYPNGSKTFMTSSVYIIATGSRPRYPKYIQGALKHCFTTDDFFWSAKPPGRTLILAASHIGLECATILANFNFPVSVLVTPTMGKDIDWEILRRTRSHMLNIKITFLEEIQIDCIEPATGNQQGLNVKGLSMNGIPFEENFDTVLMDFGRLPNTAHLGLCRIGVKVNNRTRKIIVDDEGRTNFKHIFALGDAAHGWPELGTVAKKAGKNLAHRLYRGQLRYVNVRFVPERFLFPVEYARIGKTEQSARALFGDKIKPYEADSHVLGTLSNSLMRAYFYMKIICFQGEKDEEVISVHILCHKAAEIIQGLSISLMNGATRQDFEDMIALHPIFSEVVSNMKMKYFRTPIEVYKSIKKAAVKKAAIKAMQAVEPFKTSQCKVLKKLASEEEEESGDIAKEEELRRNKGPRISKSMEKFIMDVIIKKKDDDMVVERQKEEVEDNESIGDEEETSSASDESDLSIDETDSSEDEVGNESDENEEDSDDTENSSSSSNGSTENSQEEDDTSSSNDSTETSGDKDD